MIRRIVTGVVISGLLVFTVLASPGCARKQHEGGAMKMHHMHMLMNHGLGMAAEGSNLVMIAGMKMSPEIDPSTLKHGSEMIRMSKGLIDRALSGPEMMAMMKGKHADTPLMKQTHKLGETMFKALAILAKMEMGGSMSQEMMDMHHMHIMLVHALQMAAEGGNLTMLGQMGMAGDIDDYSVKHGKMMLENARSTVAEVMEGKAMTEMMKKKGMAIDESPMMKTAHELAEVTLKIVDLLSNMPSQ